MDAEFHILVANEPGTYRQVLAAELPHLRPRLRVLSVDPADLDDAVTRLRPLLVICNCLSSVVRGHCIASIVLYPNGEDRAEVEAGGEPRLLSSPRLADLLAVIDSLTIPTLAEG